MAKVFKEVSMSRFIRGSLGALAIAMAVFAVEGPVRAVSIIAQPPCVTIGAICLQFFDASGAIPVIRSFTFKMAVPGDALVNFQGTVHCENLGGSVVLVDLAGQIVQSATAVPVYTRPGGIRSAVVLPVATTLTFSQTMNYSVSRKISYGSAGNKAVFFNIARLRMDASSVCRVFTAAFNVITVP
jgi:hypothetical protein